MQHAYNELPYADLLRHSGAKGKRSRWWEFQRSVDGIWRGPCLVKWIMLSGWTFSVDAVAISTDYVHSEAITAVELKPCAHDKSDLPPLPPPAEPVPDDIAEEPMAAKPDTETVKGQLPPCG